MAIKNGSKECAKAIEDYAMEQINKLVEAGDMDGVLRHVGVFMKNMRQKSGTELMLASSLGWPMCVQFLSKH